MNNEFTIDPKELFEREIQELGVTQEEYFKKKNLQDLEFVNNLIQENKQNEKELFDRRNKLIMDAFNVHNVSMQKIADVLGGMTRQNVWLIINDNTNPKVKSD